MLFLWRVSFPVSTIRFTWRDRKKNKEKIQTQAVGMLVQLFWVQEKAYNKVKI